MNPHCSRSAASSTSTRWRSNPDSGGSRDGTRDPPGLDLTEIIRIVGFLYGLFALGITWFVVRALSGALPSWATALPTSACACSSIRVGDRVRLDGVYGEVSAIGLRSVRLVTLDDSVITIPNNKFLTDTVSSGNWGELEMMIQLDFFVAVDPDLGLAKRLLEEALTTNRYVYLGKPWSVLVHQVIEGDYFAVRLRARAYVLDVQYERAFESDVTERVLESFRHHGVRPPARLYRAAGESGAALSAVA